MKTVIVRALAVLAPLAAVLGSVQPAVGQTVTVQPGAVTLPRAGTPSFTVTYQYAGLFAESLQGVLSSSGNAINKIFLNQIVLGPFASSVTETVVVPADVMADAVRLNVTRLRYRRVFTTGTGGTGVTMTVDVRISLQPPVTATPDPALVATGTDTLVPLHWTVSLPTGAMLRVESPEGSFADAQGRTYPPPVKMLLRKQGSGKVEFDETLVVPGSVVSAAVKRKATGLRFERIFTLANGAQYVGMLNLQPASALQGVTAQPQRIGVTPQLTSSLSVRWEGSLLPGVTGTGLSFSSPEGIFRSPDGRVLGRVDTALSEPVVTPPAPSLRARTQGPGGTAATEQLVVPHGVIDAALATGFTWFTFERSFSVGGDKATGTLRLDFTGRIASPFAIERIELRFLDGTRSKTVPLGEKEQVVADVTFRGGGTLRGSWDMAGPTSTAGAAIFTRRELVNELLSFGRRTVIRSPKIKAEQPGLYTVRLTIDEPRLDTGDRLQLSFVARATGEAMQIDLLAPPPLALLAPGMVFSWEAVAGAKNYLLEIFGTPTAEGQEPAAGMVLPGSESRATLSQAAQRNLLPGKSYWWRVVALGPGSALLGQSELSEVLTQGE